MRALNESHNLRRTSERCARGPATSGVAFSVFASDWVLDIVTPSDRRGPVNPNDETGDNRAGHKSGQRPTMTTRSSRPAHLVTPYPAAARQPLTQSHSAGAPILGKALGAMLTPP